MLFKRLSLAVLAAVASQAAMAEPTSGIIQFKGFAQHNTCAVSVSGVDSSDTATVILPEATTRKLASPGDIDGQTDFTIDVKNCLSSIWTADVSFRAAPGSSVTDGRLNNMATDSPARNVQLQIMTGEGYFPMVIQVGEPGQVLPHLNGVLIDRDHRGLKMDYRVSYYAAGPVTRGNVEAAMEYLIQYR